MPGKPVFLPGVIEGFFGRPWSWSARWDLVDFLQNNGFGSYIYAPKSDRGLRHDWDRPFTEEHRNSLRLLAARYQSRRLDFGIGLSPMALYQDFSAERRQALITKLHEINQIGPGILCLLFDDMPGEQEGLADVQCEIMNVVMAESSAQHFAFCPTYYSDDPILRQHFGQEPEGYLESLGKQLPETVDICWTGPQVLSSEYTEAHLSSVAERLQRKPLIWDNYPVNDGQRLVDHLHLRPPMRDTDTLLRLCNGHWLNPMNQAWLSRIPLYGLAQQYRQRGPHDVNSLLQQSCIAICGKELGERLSLDSMNLQDLGLRDMDENQRQALHEAITPFVQAPCAREILDWLDGRYAFDPACLT